MLLLMITSCKESVDADGHFMLGVHVNAHFMLKKTKTTDAGSDFMVRLDGHFTTLYTENHKMLMVTVC